MAFVIADRVRETTTTTGTGNLTLDGAVSKFRTFASVLSSSDTTYYSIVEQTGTAWEVGIGTFTSPTTLARTTILSSSNGGSAVNFGAGTKDVFITLPAPRTVVSISGGSTGLTPATASYGEVTLAGTMAVGSGGTGTGTAFTSGSIIFAGASGVYSQDNANLFWDNTNNRLGIGTATPTYSIETPGTVSAATIIATNLKHASSASNNIVLDSSGNATFAGTAVPSSSFLRNRIINGNMYIAQRATSATVTAGTGVPTASTGYPAVDRFFVYSTGANVTAAQVSGSGSNRNLLRITGAASVTAVGVGQRIEALNSYDLAGQTCTLSVNLANSLLTTVTWTANYATTTDTFGTIGTPTKTQIATGTFTVTSTLTRYSVNISVPAAATTGVEILLTVGAQTSGTWDIANVQFEPGSAATPFERRQYGQELALCQRYYSKSYSTGTAPATNTSEGSFTYTATQTATSANQYTIYYPVTMRAVPTVTIYTPSGTSGNITDGGTTNRAVIVENTGFNSTGFYVNSSVSSVGVWLRGHYTSSAEL